MNIQEAKQEIIHTLRAYLAKEADGSYSIRRIRQRPLLLIGAPGIGKTQIMEQAAKEEGVGLVSYTMTHHTRQSAIGLPLLKTRCYGGETYDVTAYTMSEIIASVYDAIEAGKKEGILFLDEINCVSETLAPAMLQFLQAKTFGGHRLPDGWVVVGAGNPPEYNRSVREFDVVTLDRIRLIEVEPDFSVWKPYAQKQLLHPSILAYLTIKPQYFCKMETTVDGCFFATPRGWEDLSELLQIYERQQVPVTRDIVGEYLQYPEIAKDFANYLELYYKYEDRYRVDEILAGKIDEGLCARLRRAAFDEKLSLIQLLLSRLAGGCKELLKEEDEIEALRSRYLAEKEAPQTDAAELEVLRTSYNTRAEAYEAAFTEEGQRLEHAFDFMEASFGTGQELVVFLTEMNYSSYLIRFLQRYHCERYYQYNERLQFDVQEDAILQRIRTAEGREGL